MGSDELTTQEFVVILSLALDEYSRLNEMDAHLFRILKLPAYKDAATRVEKVDKAKKELERARFMARSFLCPYCHGPLKAVLKYKEKNE
jgi:hypothetical protein